MCSLKEQELCGECGRLATYIVNDCAYICDYHAEGARLEGWLVVPTKKLLEADND